MKQIAEKIVRLFFTPRAFLRWAIALWITFGIVHALGWRECATILSGTVPSGMSVHAASYKSAFYILIYLCATLVAPILLIASALGFSMKKAAKRD